MGLHDHFRPPLSERRHWHAFHNAWATYLAADVNRLLPPGFFAEPNVKFGIEIDVAAWTPAAPTQTVALTLATDVIEVLIHQQEGGPTLAAAIEFVSPANKDRQEHRDAFTAKCAAYVQAGIGLMMVDVVTSRSGRLHEDLLLRLGTPTQAPLQSDLYATSYRPTQRAGQTLLDVWQENLALDRPLPKMGLWLRNGPGLNVDLQASYERTCSDLRISA
jgi:hypothetical protein